MAFISNSNKIVVEFQNYINTVEKSLDVLSDVFLKYIRNPKKIEEFTNPVHKYEAEADDIKDKIEQELFRGSLLPDAREDIFNIVSCYDSIPGVAQKILEFFAIQTISIPEQFTEQLKELFVKSIEGAKKLNNAAQYLLSDLNKTKDMLECIDVIESQVDHLERDLVLNIFNAHIKLAKKLLLQEFVSKIAQISDEAAHVAERMLIFCIKNKA
ncbi:MAG: DUF47 family protein [Candidatus Cloacimonadota bacterium]|nr:DUF47 family protein [Candidatus Cloacimonadota bacterium]